MNAWWLTVAAVGLAVLALSVRAASAPAIRPGEVRVFHALNRLPGWLYYVLWLPMQLGNLVIGTAVGLVAAIVDRDLAIAIGSVLAMWLKLVTEKVVRRRMGERLAVRQRPGTSQIGAILRGDVPVSGASFPSGHVILVAAIGCLVAPSIGPAWWWVPGLMTFLVMFGRVYVGAHNPLDVTAGLGVGLALGGALAVFVN